WVGGGEVREGGKGKGSGRVIPMGAFIVAILADTSGPRRTSAASSLRIQSGSLSIPQGLRSLSPSRFAPSSSRMATLGRRCTLFVMERSGKPNRHTNGNTQIASHLFNYTPEVEATRYLHGVPDDARRAALALDSSLDERQVRDNSR